MTSTMKKSFTATSQKKAWEIVNRIFPTDYMKDESGTQNAGYPVYRSTAEGHFYDYICDLCTCLEVNLSDNTTVRVWIKEPESWDYNGQY